MSRQKKNKIFDLFKSKFKISFFYKPSFEFGDEFYYLVLDDAIKVRIKIIKGTAVIDTVSPCTRSYITPLYDKLVETIMEQDRITVLVSIVGDTDCILQTCINHGAPLVEDEEYITVPKGMYTKWKTQNPNMSSYGFYILSVCEEKVEEPKEVKVVDVPVSNPIETQESNIKIFCCDFELYKIVEILRNHYPNIIINDDENNANIVDCILKEINTFRLELDKDTLYIKDLISDSMNTTLNLVEIMELLNVFEEFTEKISDVYLTNVTNGEVYRLAVAKGYQLIPEDTKIPEHKIFRNLFQGFGTFKIVIKD